MSSAGKGGDPFEQELAEIKQRLKTGKLTADDIKQLEGLVEKAETAAKNLRAAIVE